MTRHRSLRTALCVALALTAHSALGQDKPATIDTLKRIRDSGTITIGVREASVPFSFIDAQKQPQGYSIDLCLRVADAVKNELKLPRLDVRFVPVTSSNRLQMVKEGRLHAQLQMMQGDIAMAAGDAYTRRSWTGRVNRVNGCCASTRGGLRRSRWAATSLLAGATISTESGTSAWTWFVGPLEAGRFCMIGKSRIA